MPTQSPAKDLRRGSVRAGARNGLSTAQRKTFAGALFGQGREKVSEQPTERPRKALQRSVRCCWSYFTVSRSIWAKNKGSTRYADAPLARETDICTRPEEACGSVRAMPEHSTCRGCFVVLSAHRVDALDDCPVMGLRVDHLVESVFRQLFWQPGPRLSMPFEGHPSESETARGATLAGVPHGFECPCVCTRKVSHPWIPLSFPKPRRGFCL